MWYYWKLLEKIDNKTETKPQLDMRTGLDARQDQHMVTALRATWGLSKLTEIHTIRNAP